MNSLPFYITGIGASAGGITPLKSFFEHVGDNPGTAFIVIQHLAPDQRGFTKELLKNITPLPLVQVEERTKVEVNHVYLIPPTDFLVLEDLHLVLMPRTGEKRANDAIDVFFESLSKQVPEKAIGIIFSGLGSDGSKGVQLIKENGGVVMVQSPESADFSSMPLEAIMSDHPDVIGTPEQIARALVSFIKHPAQISTDPDTTNHEEMDAVEKIISLVNEFSGVNFRDYKKNTILRRIEKRFKINYKKDVEEYSGFLIEKPDEIRVLYNDLLIGVTEFFRDKQAFEFLSTSVIPELCQNRHGFATIRIWVAGCSTGEEAYSIAMLMDQHIREQNLHLDFKIFATDLDQKAIELARHGRFTKQVELQVPKQLINTYFIRRGDYYEIAHDLRKKVIFSVHNLLNNPPFIRMDLVTCRNLFIYLNAEVQKKVLYTFNYALKDKGFLMIGANESHADLGDLFDTVDYRWKIFQNKSRLSSSITQIIRPASFVNYNYQDIKITQRTNPAAIDPQQEFFAELLLEKYAPACILLTESNEVLYVTGNAEDLLTYPKRKSKLNLFDLVSGDISLVLRSGLRKVKEEKRNVVSRNVKLSTKSQDHLIADIFFYSIYSKTSSHRYIIVEIKPADKNKETQDFLEISTRENLKEIARLEAELEQAKRELQFNYDELETINEELQSSNEEMKSSNEEMQTTNEELQSANEELKTVNFELKSKIEEITVLHDDVQNLFISTQIATLFLDRDLKIRIFTPAVQSYFNIRENDIGRPIYHYTYNFKYKGWETDVEKVLNTLQPIQKEVEANQGHALIKIIPYKTDDRRIEGVIITFVDVTELKETNLKLQETTHALQLRTRDLEQAEKSWKSLVENTPDIVARINEQGTILYINQSLAQFGVDPSSLVEANIWELEREYYCKEDGLKSLNQQFIQAVRSTKAINFHQNFSVGEETKNFYVTLIPEWNSKDVPNHVLLIARDLTELRSTEKKLEDKNKRLAAMNQYMDNFVHAVAHDLRSPITNLKLILGLFYDEQSEDKREILIEKLDQSVMRIDDILNGLIEIIDSHVNISEKERKISFTSVVNKVLDQLKSELPEDTLINFNLQVDEINHVKGYIYSIIRNLISNCIKYRKKDHPLNVKIETWKEGDFKVFSVEDNGIGIDLDNGKGDLFKPFKRLTADGNGKGLGLHLVRSMVEKTGGKIEVDSEQGRGSRFYVYFKDLT